MISSRRYLSWLPLPTRTVALAIQTLILGLATQRERAPDKVTEDVMAAAPRSPGCRRDGPKVAPGIGALGRTALGAPVDSRRPPVLDPKVSRAASDRTFRHIYLRKHDYWRIDRTQNSLRFAWR